MNEDENTQNSIEECTADRNTIKKYELELHVSRNVFEKSLKKNASFDVFDRLVDDFKRREEAKRRLKEIIEKREKEMVGLNLHIPNLDEKKRKRSLSKEETYELVGRLAGFEEEKWKKVERMRNEVVKRQEEIERIVRRMGVRKSDPEVFRRLSREGMVERKEVNKKKRFSIIEAIESGKRLMDGRKSESRLIVPTPNSSSIRMMMTEESEGERIVNGYEQIRDIEEIFSKCKKNPVRGKKNNKKKKVWRC